MGVPSYILNFDELVDALQKYFEEGIKVDVGNCNIDTKTLERLLNDIKAKIQDVDYDSLIAALNSLGAKFEDLANNMGISGTQKIYGDILEVDTNNNKYMLEFKAPRNGKLTDIVYSLSAWNYKDCFDIIINDEKIFNNSRTKEHGQSIHFNVFYPVKAGDTIKFIFKSNGSSKIVWIDFHILEN
ncbi:hypothetical protein [Clostridium botulinum]|uniref:hypothetical protein n=1 Tax=Clostridium botulinum TaxID=1491 RepID=UPI001E3A7C70|nr:hypothetical protein [Clostridium botulinum]MCD3223778.1 hypothetical protein [Clostridium botulinum C/D]MCD3297162.1 hypothetical protein [Clostridium botulinum C/D]